MLYKCGKQSFVAVVLAGIFRLGSNGNGGENRISSAPAGTSRKDTAKSPLVTTDVHSRFGGSFLWLLERHGADVRYASPATQKVLERLKSNRVSSREDAERIAAEDNRYRAGRLPQEGAHVVSLVESAVDCDGFLSTGDLVWIVQLYLMEGYYVTQEAWLNARTAEIRWMLPFDGLIKSDSPAGERFLGAGGSRSSQCFRGGYLWLLPEHDTEYRILLEQLKSSKISTREDAIRVAVDDKFERVGRLSHALETRSVVALVRIGVDSTSFLSRGDLVWIVHFRGDTGTYSVTQEAWVNARSGDVRWMLPMPESEQ